MKNLMEPIIRMWWSIIMAVVSTYRLVFLKVLAKLTSPGSLSTINFVILNSDRGLTMDQQWIYDS